MDKSQAWWNSPEYRSVAPLREKSAKVNAIVIDEGTVHDRESVMVVKKGAS